MTDGSDDGRRKPAANDGDGGKRPKGDADDRRRRPTGNADGDGGTPADAPADSRRRSSVASDDAVPATGAGQAPDTGRTPLHRDAREIPAVPASDPPTGDMRPLDLLQQPIQTPGSPMSASSPTSALPPSVEVDPSLGATVAEPDPSIAPAPGAAAHAAQAVDYVPQPVPFDAPTQSTDPRMSAATADDILPGSIDDNALRDAVGAPVARPRRKKRDDSGDDGDGAKPGSRRVLVIVALATLVGVTIAGLALLGRVNAQRFVIACTTDQVSAEQGRSFPPWGTRPLVGAEWKPINLPANAECRPRETDSRAELEGWFLELLVDRASSTLTARNLLESIQPGKTNPLDIVSEQLNQALLLSRAPERRDQRKEVERLQGDVAYWRASLRLRDAAAALADAARQFDAAAAQRPRHVTDAGEWAAFLRGMVDSLHGGPRAVPTAPLPSAEVPSERPTAPAGAALPVEPDGSAAEPVEVPPDAGLPTGGVLL